MAKCSGRRYGLGLACFAVAVAMAGATQFTVGGCNGWSVPPAGAESMNAWAMKNRFQIGDKLVFVYPSDEDSVLLVEPSDYNACNTSSYVKKFIDGDTVFTLDHTGAYFFISGVEVNCRANEKLIVMVLAGGHNNTGGAPAPSTTPSFFPPPAPTTVTVPQPSSPSAPPPASPRAQPPSSPAPTSPTTASPPLAAPAPTTPSTSTQPPPAASAPATPTSTPPPPAALAPTTPKSTPPPAALSSPPAATPPSTPPSAPAGATPPFSASSPAPETHGNGTTTGTKTPSADHSNHRNGAGMTVSSGLAGSVGACAVGFAMLTL